MTTTTDPRERLLVLGNEILDALYKLSETQEWADRIQRVKDDPEAVRQVLDADEKAIEKAIERMTLASQFDTAKREYVAIRRTIEALATPRPDGAL